MKKLVCMLAAATITVVGSAATVDWLLTGDDEDPIMAKNGTSYYSGNVYLVYGSVNQAAIQAALEAGTFSATAEGIVGNAVATTADYGGFSGVKTSNDIAGLATSSGEGSKGQFYSLLVDGEANWQWGNLKESYGSTDKSTKKVAWTVSSMSGNWQAADVPEPTSAMLLLLGVAGLALRRRHA